MAEFVPPSPVSPGDAPTRSVTPQGGGDREKPPSELWQCLKMSALPRCHHPSEFRFRDITCHSKKLVRLLRPAEL